MGKLARPGVTVPGRGPLWRAQRFAEFGVPRRRHAAFNARWARDVAVLQLVKPGVLQEDVLVHNDQEGCQRRLKDVGGCLPNPVRSARQLLGSTPRGCDECVAAVGCIDRIVNELITLRRMASEVVRTPCHSEGGTLARG